MNWIKIFYLKNGEEVAINITNQSFEEVIKNIYKALDGNYSIDVENDSNIYVIKIEEVAYIEVRCTNEEN